MTGAASLRAFVAMRIGEAETDRLFERTLSPVLRDLGLTPIRIDRVDFNDDIDDRIISEIRRADVVIADLTFARPSVYYEGGFATGLGKPVIYTARRDHLHPRDSDPLGNLRVHFDLQMKNIIAWSEPESPSFRKTLARRVRNVVAPLLRHRQEHAEARAARREFLSLPLAERLESSAEMVRTWLVEDGYELADLASYDSHRYRQSSMLTPPLAPYQRVPDSILARGFVGTRLSPGMIDAVWVRVEQSFPLATLKPMNTLLEFAPPHDMNPRPHLHPNRILEHVVLVSLQPLPAARMHTAFTSFQQQDDGSLVASFQHFVPATRIDEISLLVGRFPYGPGLWRAMAFKPNEKGKGYSSGTEYDIVNGVIRRQIPGWVSVFPPTKQSRATQYEVLGKTKLLPRKVVVHVIDGVDSVPAIQAALLAARERFRRSRTRH